MNPEDERIGAWERLAAHPFFQEARGREAPLIESMIEHLDAQMTKAHHSKVIQAEEPAEERIARAFANGYREGMERATRGRLDAY